MNRIQLSPDSWIEEPDVIDTYDPASGYGSQMVGGCLCTTDPMVVATWADYREETVDAVLDATWSINKRAWELPLSALPEVYGYREGKPWCWVSEMYVGANCEPANTKPQHEECPLHLNAVILCAGSADSLRTLHRVITEVLAGKENQG